MGRRARIIGLIAVAALAAALAILWPVVGSASPKVAAASSTYTDASGDATNGGPDITTVAVSNDSSGKITFTVTIGNRPALTDVDAIQAFFDTDKNAGTGASGNQLTFKVTDAVSGYTGTNGVALNDGTTGSTSAATVAAATATFSGATGASNAISAIDAAINKVSSQRADLGAIQNRFEHTVNNLNTAIENTTSSESRIRDTDMASEMTNFTQAQVLMQAGTAMLAQANQSTQSILKLLG